MNEQLREELDYCVPLGIPHSVLLGRVPAPDEPHWLPDDMDKALAWRRNQREICSNCGTRDADWDPAQGGDRFKYVSWSDRCPGCELLAQEREMLPENSKGMRVFLVPREVGERLMESVTGWGGGYQSDEPAQPDRRKPALTGQRGLA